MKLSMLFLIFILLTAIPVFSQSPVWTIKSDSAEIYVGGSVHILREQDYPLPEVFEKAFENSDILVLEADINSLSIKEFGSKLIGMTLYPNNKSLKTELQKEVYTRLDSAFSSHGLELKKMDGLKPVMAILTLTNLELMKAGATTEGVDSYFYKKAEQQSKKILFLETMEFQIQLISAFDDDVENEYVLQSLQELKFYRIKFEEIVDWWKIGNTSGFLEELIRYKNEFPEIYQSIMVDRNNKWEPQLENYLKTPEKEFVVVGAMHLYGPDGILQLMRENGYKVEPFH